MADSTRRLTVLTTLGINAVKTFTTRDDGELHVEGYGRAKTFTAEQITIDERGKWLRRLTNNRDSFVVMGEPVGWEPGQKRRRLSSERDGDDPTLIDVPRSWMPVDIDHLDFEPMAAVDDGETLCLEVLGRLGLRGTYCVWHLTNSHGFQGKTRVRLWLRLGKPATCAQMKEYATQRWGGEKVQDESGSHPLIDMVVYRPAQPIYTGDPILVGVDDPCQERVGFVDGGQLTLKVSRSREASGPPEDENVERLTQAGLYIGRLRPGQHKIRCPWEDDHTDTERDDDTFYFEPHYNGHDIPAFKCHHGHCAQRKWSDVIDELGIKSTSFSPVSEDDDTPPFVFITRLKQFWDSRDGALIDKESYDYEHGGVGSKGATSPTQRFLASNKTLKVNVAEFLPGDARVVKRGKLKALNTYVDKRTAPDPTGDAEVFVQHLRWLVQDETERDHLTDWMAWAYQHPERKITWAPILYGPPGTGKTSVMNVLAGCLGSAYASEPAQAELEDKFTDWAFGKLLVKIEELRSEDRYNVAEKLKPIVANPTISIRRMHETGFRVKNVANVMASTNHMEALPIERGDRRYMLITCRDEPNVVKRTTHMRIFHHWLEREGLGGVAWWLSSRDVKRFKPESEAPMTALKDVVIEATQTELERAIDLCEAFDGAEIVTSSALSEYLENNVCTLSSRRLGLIASRRKWASLNGRDNRFRHNGKRVTLWSPTGPQEKIKKVLYMEPAFRNAFLNKVNTKLLDGKETWVKPKKDDDDRV
jgi:DNA polymerase III delta prime subunit